jgi:hypothetical protein
MRRINEAHEAQEAEEEWQRVQANEAVRKDNLSRQESEEVSAAIAKTLGYSFLGLIVFLITVNNPGLLGCGFIILIIGWIAYCSTWGKRRTHAEWEAIKARKSINKGVRRQ